VESWLHAAVRIPWLQVAAAAIVKLTQRSAAAGDAQDRRRRRRLLRLASMFCSPAPRVTTVQRIRTAGLLAATARVRFGWLRRSSMTPRRKAQLALLLFPTTTTSDLVEGWGRDVVCLLCCWAKNTARFS